MDDILIYLKTMEEHVSLVRQVMERLRNANLCVSINKSNFHQREIELLGYQISDHGMAIMSMKLDEIKVWSTP